MKYRVPDDIYNGMVQSNGRGPDHKQCRHCRYWRPRTGLDGRCAQVYPLNVVWSALKPSCGAWEGKG